MRIYTYPIKKDAYNLDFNNRGMPDLIRVHPSGHTVRFANHELT